MKFRVTNISPSVYLTVAGAQLNHRESTLIEAEDFGAIDEQLRLFKMHGIVSIEAEAEVTIASQSPVPGMEVPFDEQ